MLKISEKTEPMQFVLLMDLMLMKPLNREDVESYNEQSQQLNSSTPSRLGNTTQFTLSYIGVLEQLRNPENLWKALDDLVNLDFSENFSLKFAGRIDDKILHEIENSGLKIIFQI
jgi:hypothetical protein